MSTFKIERAWAKSSGGSAAAATAARIRVLLGDRIVSRFTSETEPPGDELELPLYYLAEWLAENWWPLLWEPRKNESDDAGDFLSRHSLLFAQHGFALPSLSFIPQGGAMTVRVAPRDAALADVRFTTGAEARLPRGEVESELRKFVSSVVKRLSERSISGTDLQEEWALIDATAPNEAMFCRLMGALGLSPYAEGNERIADALEQAGGRMNEVALLDLCETSTPEAFEVNVRLADIASELTARAPESTLRPLASRSPPADNPAAEAWRRGVMAVKSVRTALNIKEADPAGGTKFLDLLGIDSSGSEESTTATDEEGYAVVGAVERDDQRSRIALLQKATVHRRFTAARAAYLAWTADRPQATRLLTQALTREQQASRAFAAEMMAPIAQIRPLANRNMIGQEEVYTLADTLRISPGLVAKQAMNNGIRITRA